MQPHGCALVTGASRGLGRGIALELARRGFDVIAGVRDERSARADLEAAAHGLAGTLKVQVLDLAALGDYQPPKDLCLLVNNAGLRGRYLPIEHADVDEWRSTFETNVYGVVSLTQRAIPALREQRGVICNIGSLGVYAPNPFYAMYRASKAALAAIGESLRLELAPFGVRVIDIPIGGVDTDMLRSGIMHRAAEAADHADYKPLADRQRELMAQFPAVPGPEVVAIAIVDEILKDDTGPLRRPCDPIAKSVLAAGAADADEQRLATAMARLGL